MSEKLYVLIEEDLAKHANKYRVLGTCTDRKLIDQRRCSMLNTFIGWMFVRPPLLPLFAIILMLISGSIGGVMGNAFYEKFLK